MQLRAATKQTNPNFVRVIRQKFQSNARLGSGCHKPFYRHMFVLIYIYITFLKLPAPPRAALLVNRLRLRSSSSFFGKQFLSDEQKKSHEILVNSDR